MTKKLLFFDVDGTLLTNDHKVPDSTTEALRRLREAGHVCIINTGRPYSGLDDLIRSIEVDGYICGCGTYVRLGDDVLYARHFSPETAYAIITSLDRHGLEWILEGEDAVYYSTEHEGTRMKRVAESMKTKIPDKIIGVTEADYPSLSFDKFCLMPTSDGDLEGFKEEFSSVLHFIDRGHDFYEIHPIECSKAVGMAFLADHLKIDRKDTFGFGDSTNDIAMLEAAGTGVVMGNANPKLYPLGDYVTAPVDEDGIFLAVQHYGLIS